jgi:hypothetical protein
MKRLIQVLLCLSIALLVAPAVSGCGKQTEQANQLVDEVNALAASAEPKLDQADQLLTQATEQLSQGKTEDEKNSLTRAQAIIDEIMGDIRTAKAKTDEAAALDISDTYRQYLQAKGRALEEALGLNQTSRDITVLLLADLTVEKPDTLARLTELENASIAQAVRLKAAEDEADSIAESHTDEIK